MDDGDLRMQLGGDPGRRRAQAEVEVLGEEEVRGVERAEAPQQRRARHEAGRDRPADDARGLGAPRVEPLAQRPRQQAGMDDRGHERVSASWHRVRAALHRPVRVQQPRGEERVAAGSERGEPRERVVAQLTIRVQQDGHRRGHPGQARVVRGAEPWVVMEPDHLGAPALGPRGAVVA
ncbi:hypothetical protein LRS13_19165 [Svornostia abyssi]|uniref:Uncharacterized protein n=1 Tax=Svornostia abyssi TaxID=2898438 RepID=A0ABY5PE51_9ACTN|nr:hypothetical protein LRS13_19165 [Parviterribacteraceae bacterium J379]